VRLSTLGPIRAALTSQDLSSDTKFSPSQSRVMLPLNDVTALITVFIYFVSKLSYNYA